MRSLAQADVDRRCQAVCMDNLLDIKGGGSILTQLHSLLIVRLHEVVAGFVCFRISECATWLIEF